MKRKEDPRLITGSGTYVDDIQLKGMLHTAFLRSPYAHARILKIDLQRAQDRPGVVAILTGKDCVQMMEPIESYIVPDIEEYPLAVDKVRYAGEPVVAVAATSREKAEDALELIDVEYEPLPVVLDPEKAMLPDSPVLFEKIGKNVVWSGTFAYGDVETEIKSAPLVLGAKFHFHRFSSTPLETNGVIASYEPGTGSITFWSNYQNPGQAFETLSRTLRIPGNKLRLIVPEIGGGFGMKVVAHRYLLSIIGLLSIKTGRPVKYFEDRRENMVSGQTCEAYISVRAAVRSDGVFTGMEIKDIENEGGALGFAVYHITNKLNNLTAVYSVKNVSLTGFSVATNEPPSSANRGIGKPMMCFVWERMMEMAARKLGLDPTEIRMRNYVKPEEFPYTTPNGNLYGAGNYHESLRKALDIIDYKKQREFQRTAREQGRLIGIGFSTSVEPGGMNLSRHALTEPHPTKAGASEATTIKIDVTGLVTVALSQPDAGEGHCTTTAQIVADELGVDFDDVNVATAFDTLANPWTGYSTLAGNDFTPISVPSIIGAARDLRHKVLKVASFMLKTDVSELEIERSTVFLKKDKSKSVTFKEIAHLVYYQSILLPPDVEPGLQSTFFFRHPSAFIADEKRRVKSQLSYGNAVHVAILEVNKDTGSVKILRYVVVGDAGTIVNPLIVQGQIHGNTVHGISTTLGEGFVYDEAGQLQTGSFADYMKPTAVEAPNVEVYHFTTRDPTNPLGAKSVGEGGAILAPAAIANAVEDALFPNIDVNQLPLNYVKIWEAVNKRGKA